jgi:hypothetical protein
LTEDEKILAAWRLEVDIGEDDWVDSKQQSMFYGAKLAFKYVSQPSSPRVGLTLSNKQGYQSMGAARNYLWLHLFRRCHHIFPKVSLLIH